MADKLRKEYEAKRLSFEFSREWIVKKRKSIKIRNRRLEKQKIRFEKEIEIVGRVNKAYGCVNKWKEAWKKTAACWLTRYEIE